MEQKLYFKDYNEALKQNKLLGLKCRACGAITIPPKMACRQCANPDMEIVEVKSSGKIKTFTTIFVGAEGLGKPSALYRRHSGIGRRTLDNGQPGRRQPQDCFNGVNREKGEDGQ